MHNYAWYKYRDGSQTDPGAYYKMGDGNLTGGHFADFWRRMSVEFKSDPGLYYDLMNEPGVQGSIPLNGYSSQAQAWEHYSQQAVDAIRSTGDTNKIMIPTWRNSATNAATYHPQGPWIYDPANNYQYAFHMYFWVNGTNNYNLDYQTENANAVGTGY